MYRYSNNATLVVLLRVRIHLLLDVLCLIVVQRPIDREIFVVLRQVIDNNAKTSPQPGIEPLRERLLRDTLPRAVDTNQADFQTMLNNLLTYVEVVYHQGYSAEMMMCTGFPFLLCLAEYSFSRRSTADPASSQKCRVCAACCESLAFAVNCYHPYPTQQSIEQSKSCNLIYFPLLKFMTGFVNLHRRRLAYHPE